LGCRSPEDPFYLCLGSRYSMIILLRAEHVSLKPGGKALCSQGQEGPDCSYKR
jgi:hypothetical protein